MRRAARTGASAAVALAADTTSGEQDHDSFEVGQIVEVHSAGAAGAAGPAEWASAPSMGGWLGVLGIVEAVHEAKRHRCAYTVRLQTHGPCGGANGDEGVTSGCAEGKSPRASSAHAPTTPSHGCASASAGAGAGAAHCGAVLRRLPARALRSVCVTCKTHRLAFKKAKLFCDECLSVIQTKARYWEAYAKTCLLYTSPSPRD